MHEAKSYVKLQKCITYIILNIYMNINSLSTIAMTNIPLRANVILYVK